MLRRSIWESRIERRLPPGSRAEVIDPIDHLTAKSRREE
jgi:hypothetical protein